MNLQLLAVAFLSVFIAVTSWLIDQTLLRSIETGFQCVAYFHFIRRICRTQLYHLSMLLLICCAPINGRIRFMKCLMLEEARFTR